MRLHVAAVPLPTATPAVQVSPWKPFVYASLAYTLTLGALTGAIDLWHLRVALEPVPVDHHRAHGFAQLFGFLGLFTMGMSLHLAPRFFGGAPAGLARRRLMTWAGIGGVALLVAGRLGSLVPGSAALSVVGALLVFAAMTAWATLVLRLWRDLPLGGGDAMQRFLLAGAAWWWLASAFTVRWTLGEALGAGASQLPLEVVWAAALLGGTGSWLWGIFMRAGVCTLHVKRPTERAQLRLFVGWQVAAALAVLAPWVEQAWLHAVQHLVMAGAVALLWWTFRPLSADGLDGDKNFARRAVQVGLCFVALYGALSVWMALAQLGLGAPPLLRDVLRHTLTLGGVTLLVLGFAGRMVPGFAGRTLTWSGLYDAGVTAVALSALLRSSELVTSRLGLSLAGASGGLAFLGLGCVAAALVRTLTKEPRG